MPLREVVQRYPLALGASLTKKLLVPYAFLTAKNPPVQKLPTVNGKEEAFCARCSVSLQRFQSFAVDWLAASGRAIEQEIRRRHQSVNESDSCL